MHLEQSPQPEASLIAHTFDDCNIIESPRVDKYTIDRPNIGSISDYLIFKSLQVPRHLVNPQNTWRAARFSSPKSYQVWAGHPIYLRLRMGREQRIKRVESLGFSVSLCHEDWPVSVGKTSRSCTEFTKKIMAS